ncbi:MAG: hypothetical protein KDI30_03250, partial [Pseudomonadales bacterium]|nr:hypothetical protein [Pseudomonadales bacterium]
MRQFLFLLLSCFFSVPVLALFNDAPTAFSASKANPSLFETSTDTFLPLEKAYRLAISINNEQKKIYLDWDIADDYYLYRHRFAVELFVDGQAVASSTVYEPGLVAYDEYYERELEKFYRHTRIEVNHDQAMLSGLSLRVGFQGCADAGLCYPPEYWNYRYKADSGVFVRAAADLSAQPGHEQFLKGVSTVEVIEGGDRARFALMLLFAFLGGLLLNLMPCVFPVLSIKVMSFATHAMRPAVLHRHGWSYTLGVISSLLVFVGILLALKAAGKAVGWGFQLQSPVFVGLLVYLFFMLGLSFSGVLSFGERLMNLGSS